MRRLLFVALGAFFIAAVVLPTQSTFVVRAVSDGERLAMYSKPAVVRIIDGAAGQILFQPPGYQGQVYNVSAIGLGSGFFISNNGYIATNAHVVSGASSITVQTHDGKTYKATLVGSDPTTDVAVIHIDAPSADLHALTLGDSASLRVGDAVIAIGDPFGLADSVSAGIVSALDRTITSPNNHPIQNAIQTDAAINHGNSGGPLLNAEGQVIGITSQIYADGSTSGNVGIGFAVPSSTVQSITRELIASGKAAHAYLGVYLQDTSGGARITKVTSGSPAAAAGLTAGEVIAAIDGQRAAAVAVVDRGIGLDQSLLSAAGHGAVQRADHASRDRVLEVAQRAADRDHRLTRL